MIARSYIDQLVRDSDIRPSDVQGLQKLGLLMQKAQRTLGQMGCVSDLDNSENLLKITRRLPNHIRDKWVERADSIIEAGYEPNFADLTRFVQERVRVVNNVYGKDLNQSKNVTQQSKSKSLKSTKVQPSQGGIKFTLATQGASSVAKSSKPNVPRSDCCILCNRPHHIWSCYAYKKKPVHERREFAKLQSLCYNCGYPGHLSRGCVEKGAYNSCKGKHHSLLHSERIKDDSTVKSSTVTSDTTTSNPSDSSTTTSKPETGESGWTYATSSVMNKQVLMKIVPAKVVGQHKVVETYALLDGASDSSYYTSQLAQEIGLEGDLCEFEMNTMNGSHTQTQSLRVSFELEGIDSGESIMIQSAWTVSDIPVSESNIPKNSDLERYPHLSGLKFPEIGNKEVNVLIGCDNPDVFWTLDERRGKGKQPYALKTLLGWSLIGPTSDEVQRSPSTANINFTRKGDTVLLQQLHEMWKTEFNDVTYSSEGTLSLEDKKALEIMDATVTRVDGHYQLSLPWRRSPPSLQDNRDMAEKRLKGLKRRLSKDATLHEKYTTAMEDYLVQNFASKVPQEELSTDGPAWYIPHHAVVHPRKPGKVRVVYYCAAKYNGQSLNDQLLHGPDFMNNLIGILTRFREGPTAFMADIQGMFNQVRVSPADRRYLRFLWWPNGNMDVDPEVYQMNVHLFGATSSPSCASYCLRRTAKDHEHEHEPEVSRTVIRNFYVDDLLKSVFTVEEALHLVEELPVMLHKGGFKLLKWSCNNEEVKLAIHPEDLASKPVDLDLEQKILPHERALGIKWNVAEDQFEFETVQVQKPITRRGVLSMVSTIFDPLGFLSPVILPAKQLLQDTCRMKLGWNEQFNSEFQARWMDWLKAFDSVSEITIPRCMIPEYVQLPYVSTLHYFSDACETGYGSVCYLRVVDSVGQIHVSLAMAKSRVAPLKPVTDPQLELAAAVLSIKLDKMMKDELDVNLEESVFWTDAMAVLQYMNNKDRRFQIFRRESSRDHSWELNCEPVEACDFTDESSWLRFKRHGYWRQCETKSVAQWAYVSTTRRDSMAKEEVSREDWRSRPWTQERDTCLLSEYKGQGCATISLRKVFRLEAIHQSRFLATTIQELCYTQVRRQVFEHTTDEGQLKTRRNGSSCHTCHQIYSEEMFHWGAATIRLWKKFVLPAWCIEEATADHDWWGHASWWASGTLKLSCGC